MREVYAIEHALPTHVVPAFFRTESVTVVWHLPPR
jgi:hypothetical protein